MDINDAFALWRDGKLLDYSLEVLTPMSAGCVPFIQNHIPNAVPLKAAIDEAILQKKALEAEHRAEQRNQALIAALNAKANAKDGDRTRKKRKQIPRRVDRRVIQEAGSKCGLCPDSDVAALETHHIDGDPANNTIENLFLVCGSCHNKITAGDITEETVRAKKRQLAMASNNAPKPITSMDGIHIGKPQFVPRRLAKHEMRMKGGGWPGRSGP